DRAARRGSSRTRSYHSESQHSVRHLLEAGDIGALHVVYVPAELLTIGQATVVDVVHDFTQHKLQLRLLPGPARRVLAHFQPGHRDTAGVGRLAGPEHRLRPAEVVRRFQVARHVRPFRHGDAAVGHQRARIVAEQLVLGRAGEGDVAGYAPRRLPRVEGRAFELLGIFADPAA